MKTTTMRADLDGPLVDYAAKGRWRRQIPGSPFRPLNGNSNRILPGARQFHKKRRLNLFDRPVSNRKGALGGGSGLASADTGDARNSRRAWRPLKCYRLPWRTKRQVPGKSR
jgi:hypothetical protein